jgi:MFS family permease
VGSTKAAGERWYAGVSRYQWLVLLLASLGWIFDIFEGQIFVASMNEAMPALLPAGAGPGEVGFYNNLALGAFLLGGALGGVLFGMLGDRLGRKRALTYTILLYSACTCLSAFAQCWWHLAGFRFLTALGVGGEWAVASTLVAEEFPRRARAWSQSIFQASSVLGTYLAILAGTFVVAQREVVLSLPVGTWAVSGWRLAFLLGALPALLVVWVRRHLHEPERWLRAAKAGGEAPGRLRELFAPGLARRTLVGVGLAGVGMATFWATFIYGKDVLRQAVAAEDPSAGPLGLKRAEMLGMFLATTGSGLGLLAFGPLAERLGRRGAFLFFLLGGLAASGVLFWLPLNAWEIGLLLPVFGFLTVGLHGGYAVYFPELFPTHLRGTGAGFCFNAGRVLAAPALFLGGLLEKYSDLKVLDVAPLLGLLFPLGAFLLLFAPETKGRDLPER